MFKLQQYLTVFIIEYDTAKEYFDGYAKITCDKIHFSLLLVVVSST